MCLGLIALGTVAQADIYGYKHANGKFIVTDKLIAAPDGFVLNSHIKTKTNKAVARRFSHRKYDKLIKQFAEKYGVDPALVKSVIHAESAFDARAISSKGAQGLMQLMPATAKQLGVVDSFDPAQNIEGGVKHLRFLLDYYESKTDLALAAYNAGQGAVDRYSNIPPFVETQGYVHKVKQLFHRYAKNG